MIKVRYFRVSVPFSIEEIGEVCARAPSVNSGETITIVAIGGGELILRYQVLRTLTAIRISIDGEEIKESIPTVERLVLRMFTGSRGQYLSIIDPPRSMQNILGFLQRIVGSDFFIEPIEINRELVTLLTRQFETAKLVSAKVRDFSPYEGAVGRFEVSSKEGLKPDIAPFLDGKFYRIDSLTFEIVQGFKKGMVCYLANGTIRASDSIKNYVFPFFEKSL